MEWIFLINSDGIMTEERNKKNSGKNLIWDNILDNFTYLHLNGELLGVWSHYLLLLSSVWSITGGSHVDSVRVVKFCKPLRTCTTRHIVVYVLISVDYRLITLGHLKLWSWLDTKLCWRLAIIGWSRIVLTLAILSW